MVVYIKNPNLTDSNGNKSYIVFPDWEQFDNFYNVEVVDFAPTVKICERIWRDNYVNSST